MGDPNPYASPLVTDAIAPEPRPEVQVAADILPRLQRTRIGLTLIYAGLAVVVLGSIARFAVTFGQLWSLHSMAQGVVMFGFLAMFIGPFFCLTVPTESRAKRFILWSVIFQAIHAVLTMVATYWYAMTWNTMLMFDRSGQAAWLIGFVLFLLFLKRLGHYIGRDDLARRAQNLLVLVGFVISLFLCVFLMMSAAIFPVQAALLLGAVLSLGLVLALIASVVMYARLLCAFRKALKITGILDSGD